MVRLLQVIMACTHFLAKLLGETCAICSGEAPVRQQAENLPEVSTDWLAGTWRHDGPTSLLDAELLDVEDCDPAELVEYLRRLDDDACRSSLAEFVKLAFAITNPGVELEWGPHCQAICDHIQWQLEDRWRCVKDRSATLKYQNLLINVPPRSLKTTILTCATVWAWLHWPTLKIMYLSANPRVSSNSARMARNLMRSEWFQTTFRPYWNPHELDKDGRPTTEPDPLWGVSADHDALSDLGNTAGGHRIARGLASTTTGEGCDLLLVDDPHGVNDGPELVEKTCENYDGATANRLNDPRTALRMMIMQRVRINDLSARWIAAGDLIHLRLPMEFESECECPCGTCEGTNAYGWKDWRTVEGDTLLPERFTQRFLEKEKARLLSQYVGQHQQRPTAAGGQIFKTGWWWWHSLSTATPQARPTNARTVPAHVIGRRRDGSLDLDWLCVSVDATGGSTATKASALGIGIIGGKGQRRHVLRDLTDGPRTWLQTLEDIVNAVKVAVAIAGRQPRITVLVEKKALGQALIEQITKALHDGELKYSDGRRIVASVVAYEPTGKGCKVQRAEAMEPDISAGLVSLEDGGDWVPAFRAELEGFPKAPRDDRVDYLSQCLDHFRGKVNSWIDVFRKKKPLAAPGPVEVETELVATG